MDKKQLLYSNFLRKSILKKTPRKWTFRKVNIDGFTEFADLRITTEFHALRAFPLRAV